MIMNEKIRQARISDGITCAALASAIGVEAGVIAAYEQGTSKPEINQQIRLSQVLDISIYYLRHDDCDNPRQFSCAQQAMIEFYEHFGINALMRYEEELSRLMKEDQG
ncbi:MAG: helix-turn-helix transcriptional regulator [Oscillospiraceae bacterium]|nr:helix-turn-helix transcriptional regulator [Oscillospiraceae bacterium]